MPISKSSNTTQIYQRLIYLIRRVNVVFLLTIMALLLGVYLDWSFGNVVIFCVIIYLILCPVSNQIMIGGIALLLFIVTLLLILGKTELADEFAVISYYYLCLYLLSIILQLSDRNIRIRCRWNEKLLK